MTLRRHARLTAWLGLIAMWLIVCVPIVSQLVVASHEGEPVAALCSATESPDVSHHSAPDSLSACGYCDLLATHAAMPALPAVAAPMLTLVVIMTAPVLSVRFTPLGAFPSGRPRDPPLVS
ncbi:DUF2946 domain-containing protein [Trinickia symbiotica]|uniref:DUF2946 domain-containing protein n=1 Tax=Trinickia symbiotica TaxID=863227 RepID=A0A2N7X9Q5_9BURK|nr:DUF2946 domain-containing protein [Trinickia symbiotica]PMS38351.1 DUF2946 domain-containing protein [Trinickia symbiotica]